ncbi:MAG TPA: PEP-CTERM sorting domain-containing protein [Fimbriimonadaceae bacterium]|nr:PEP-CTERM sorting domain-containing protein [Fimbriimonadaceae bacterium]
MQRSTFIILGLAISSMASAQFASDNASNAPYVLGEEYIQVGTTPGDQTAATNGMNGGFGFEKWQRGGYGSPTNAGSTKITNLGAGAGMGAQQFNMRSAPDGSEGADARRRLLNDLEVGQSLSFSMLAGGGNAGQQNTNGWFGVEIRSTNLSNPGRDMFSINGWNGGNWELYGASGGVDTGVAVTPGQRLDVQIGVLGGDMFSVALTPFGGSTTALNVGSISAGVKLRTMQFYVYNTNGDFMMNNLQAVPEPATLVAVGAGLLMLARRRRRA